MSLPTFVASAGLLLGSLPVTAQRLENPNALRLVGEQLEQVRLLRGDTPMQHYPPAAKAAAIDGSAVVDVLLNEVGQVLEAQVVSESPRNAGFGLAALDTAKTFEFENQLKRLVVLSLTIEFQP
jgi:TonB family protein